MIKRRFYKLEHGDKDIASDSSSSSSDSELEAEATEESDESEEDAVAEVKENDESVSSGYESEDSSANEVDVDSADLVNEDDDKSEDDRQVFVEDQLSSKQSADETMRTKFSTTVENGSLPDDFPACILKYKSVFKCKLCPRVVCLNEGTVRTHVKSKRHSRSEKLLKEGRLKAILNSVGEIEEQEIDIETHAPPQQDNQKKKQRGHRRGKGPRRKRSREEKRSTKDGAKKRHKNNN